MKDDLAQISQSDLIVGVLATIQEKSKDDVSVAKIYIDICDGDWVAGAILDELIFWTIPKKGTRKTKLRVWKNGKLWLVCSRSEWWDRKRIKERQADRGIAKLIEMKLVEKTISKFSGKPQMHLRIIPKTFFELYMKAIKDEMVDFYEDDIQLELEDLYEMMRWSDSPNGELPPSDSPNGDSDSPNGEIINSPNTSRTVNNPISGEKTATSIPEPELVEPGSEFDEEKPSRYAKWQHPRTALEKRIIACIARKKYWNKEDRKDNKLTQLRTIEKSISKLKPGAPIDKQPDYPEEWISACVNWYEKENKTKCIPLKGFLTVVTEKPEWRARIIAEALKGKTIAIGSWGN